MIVNSVELMRQRIDPRDGKAEVGVVFLGQGDADGFEAEFEQARLALEDGLLALDLDGGQVLVRQGDAPPECVGARADQVDQDETVTGGGGADDAHRFAELRASQDYAIDDVGDSEAHARASTPKGNTIPAAFPRTTFRAMFPPLLPASKHKFLRRSPRVPGLLDALAADTWTVFIRVQKNQPSILAKTLGPYNPNPGKMGAAGAAPAKPVVARAEWLAGLGTVAGDQARTEGAAVRD